MTDHWLTGDLKRSIAHRETRRLIWPASEPCPVKKGERFKIRGWLTIEIEKVTRHLPKGQPAEWHAEFIRHETDRPQLLRRTPAGLPLQPHELAGYGEIERARRDGSYTTSPALALIDEPESVGPDWQDPERMNREVARQQARAEHEAELREHAIRKHLTRVTAGLTLPQRLQVLDQIEQSLRDAEKLAA